MYQCNKLYRNFIHTTPAHTLCWKNFCSLKQCFIDFYWAVHSVFRFALSTFCTQYENFAHRKMPLCSIKANNGKCHTNSTIGILMHIMYEITCKHIEIYTTFVPRMNSLSLSRSEIYFIFMENSHNQQYDYSNKNISTMQTNCKICSGKRM